MKGFLKPDPNPPLIAVVWIDSMLFLIKVISATAIVYKTLEVLT